MENKSKDMSWLDRDIKRFKEVGTVIPEIQYKIYQKIKDFWVSGRTVVDIGCSIGVGSNILSNKARYVWGLDVNEEAINFAKHVFARDNMDFEVYDLENPPSRSLATFEVVTMVEVIEHLADLETGLYSLKTLFGKDTIGFITAPNINNEEIKERDAKNELHLNRWTAGEFYQLMTKHFNSVVLYGYDHLKNWHIDETVDGNSTDKIIIAKVEGAKYE